jgi:hypothetical protein
MRCTIRQHPNDPQRWSFDFDPAAPGGRGGASLRLDSVANLVSIDGVRKNSQLPPRSTGALLADGLRQAGMLKPAILEGYNVERSTAIALANGSNGQGTLIGNLLEDLAMALGGSISRWEPIQDGNAWHLRVHVTYP